MIKQTKQQRQEKASQVDARKPDSAMTNADKIGVRDEADATYRASELGVIERDWVSVVAEETERHIAKQPTAKLKAVNTVKPKPWYQFWRRK